MDLSLKVVSGYLILGISHSTCNYFSMRRARMPAGKKQGRKKQEGDSRRGPRGAQQQL